MSLRNFAQTLLLLGAGTVYCGPARAENVATTLDKPAVTAALPRAARSAKTTTVPIGDADQDGLIDEILGLTESKPAIAPKPAASDGDVFTCVALEQPAGEGTTSTPRRQRASGTVGGRIIGVNLDTSTVDIEFEGQRRTTVGSQFSVHHDYALSSQHLGRVEVVYLAGGNRVIAKPVGRADITRMGKGDRVNGRIVPKKASQEGANGSGQGDAKGSCVSPPGGDMPVPPPDVETPYVPQDSLTPETPTPSLDETTNRGAKPKLLLANLFRRIDLKKTDEGAKAIEVLQAAPAEKAEVNAALPAKPSEPPAPAVVQCQTAPTRLSTQRVSGPPLPLPAKSRIGDSRLGEPPIFQPHWSAVTPKSWSALLNASRRPPETAALQAQHSRLASASKLSSKSLWCAVKPKPLHAPKPVAKAVAAVRFEVAAPSIVLFEQ
jgi:hypothetical protein